jgi:hypothetical protein
VPIDDSQTARQMRKTKKQAFCRGKLPEKLFVLQNNKRLRRDEILPNAYLGLQSRTQQ